MFWCTTSIWHFEQKNVIDLMINDMCIKRKKTSKTCYQEGERYDEKNEKKESTKMTSFPAPGIEPWPRTATWCSQMLYSLSCGELVGMWDWTLKSCFRCPTKETSLQWFGIVSISERKLFRLIFPASIQKYVFTFIFKNFVH